MITDLMLALGAALVGSGAMTLVTASRQSASPDSPIPPRDVAKIVGRAAASVIVAFAVRRLIEGVDSPLLDVVLALLAVAAVGAVLLRLARPASRNAAAGLVLVVAGTMLCAAWLGDRLFTDTVTVPAAGGTGAAVDDDPVVTGDEPTDLTSDSSGDCDCGPSDDLTTIGVGGDGTVVVEAAAELTEGSSIWLWFERHPYSPVRAVLEADGWSFEVSPNATTDFSSVTTIDDPGRLHLRLGFDPGPVAATTASGDRAPDLGYVAANGGTSEPDPTDPLVTDVQAAIGSMSPDRWPLALTLLGAATTRGTTTYELGHGRDPGVLHTREILATEDAWVVHDDGGAMQGGTSLFIDPTGGAPSTRCAWSEEGTMACEESSALGPLAQLQAYLADPTATETVVVASRLVDDRSTVCVAVAAAATDGPHIGEFCSFSDGQLAFLDDRTEDDVAVFVRHDDVVDERRLVVPEAS